jgi:hypothetical protein
MGWLWPHEQRGIRNPVKAYEIGSIETKPTPLSVFLWLETKLAVRASCQDAVVHGYVNSL